MAESCQPRATQPRCTDVPDWVKTSAVQPTFWDSDSFNFKCHGRQLAPNRCNLDGGSVWDVVVQPSPGLRCCVSRHTCDVNRALIFSLRIIERGFEFLHAVSLMCAEITQHRLGIQLLILQISVYLLACLSFSPWEQSTGLHHAGYARLQISACPTLDQFYVTVYLLCSLMKANLKTKESECLFLWDSLCSHTTRKICFSRGGKKGS